MGINPDQNWIDDDDDDDELEIQPLKYSQLHLCKPKISNFYMGPLSLDPPRALALWQGFQ